MTLYDQMPFPPHQGIPFDYAPPKLDGFVEPNPGVATTQLDPGYTAGPRFAFGGASGVPMVVFQGIKHNAPDQLLYMGFVARYDPGFDGKDFVSIFLKPTPGAAPSAADRRIDVHPNLPLPSPNPAPVTTSTAGVPAAPVDPDGNDRPRPSHVPPDPALPEIRTNKPPNIMNVYKRTPAGTDKWASMAAPPGLDCKVRSEFDGVNRFWSVELQVPTTSAGDWIALASTFGLYFNVGVGWTDASAISYVVQYPWPYDPDNPISSFLADPSGFSITPENWDPPLYGSGLLLNPGDPNPALGVRFLNDAYGIGVLSGASIGGSVDMTLGHVNKMVARLQNTGPNTAKKVRARFRIAEFGISGGLYSGSAAWEDLPTPTTNPAPHTGVDIPTTPGATYHDIELDWTVSAADHAKFHTLSSDQCLWVQLDTVATVPAPPPGQPAPAGAAVGFVEDSVRRNLWFSNLSNIRRKAILDASHLDLQHLVKDTHDVFLQVASTPVKAVDQTPVEKALLAAEITHESFRPMLARAATPAPIARATTPAAHAAPIASLLNENPILSATVARAPLVKEINPRIKPQKLATWFTAVNGYQVLGNRTLTFAGGEKAKIVVYVGSYGYIAQHALKLGETIDKLQLSHQLAGPALEPIGNNMYRGKLAPQAKVELLNSLKTVPISRLPTPLARPAAIVMLPVMAIVRPVSNLVTNMIRRPAAPQ
jgi:hypothetical protein